MISLVCSVREIPSDLYQRGQGAVYIAEPASGAGQQAGASSCRASAGASSPGTAAVSVT